MLGNLAVSILRHYRVETLHSNALAARRVVERLITFGKRGDLHARRVAARTIHDKEILKKLFGEIAPKFMDRHGGYTRVIKKGFRQGDAASVSIIELVGLAQKETVEEGKAEKQPDKKEKKAGKPKAESKKG
jgi:large subunit ribosomal protein L17